MKKPDRSVVRTARKAAKGEVLTRFARWSSVFMALVVTPVAGWTWNHFLTKADGIVDEIHNTSNQVRELNSKVKKIGDAVDDFKKDKDQLATRVDSLERARAVKPPIKVDRQQPNFFLFPH